MFLSQAVLMCVVLQQVPPQDIFFSELKKSAEAHEKSVAKVHLIETEILNRDEVTQKVLFQSDGIMRFWNEKFVDLTNVKEATATAGVKSMTTSTVTARNSEYAFCLKQKKGTWAVEGIVPNGTASVPVPANPLRDYPYRVFDMSILDMHARGEITNFEFAEVGDSSPETVKCLLTRRHTDAPGLHFEGGVELDKSHSYVIKRWNTVRRIGGGTIRNECENEYANLDGLYLLVKQSHLTTTSGLEGVKDSKEMTVMNYTAKMNYRPAESDFRMTAFGIAEPEEFRRTSPKIGAYSAIGLIGIVAIVGVWLKSRPTARS